MCLCLSAPSGGILRRTKGEVRRVRSLNTRARRAQHLRPLPPTRYAFDSRVLFSSARTRMHTFTHTRMAWQVCAHVRASFFQNSARNKHGRAGCSVESTFVTCLLCSCSKCVGPPQGCKQACVCIDAAISHICASLCAPPHAFSLFQTAISLALRHTAEWLICV
jgi:hypothetical protein